MFFMSEMKASFSSKKRLKQATLDTSSKRRKTDDGSSNYEKRAGVIKCMVLKNFMCHSLLEIEFTSNTSVLIGQNGSGKSAVLTALVVGLGGKANITNRGTSIKGFVKAGSNSANVEIVLHNGGPMAYKPNIYGTSITVIRHITAAGSSSYKIKGHTGEIISTQAREIQNITRSLNIQIDNPICVLNQDTSRNFLSSNDPKQKFSLFMKATKLETLNTEYNRTLTNMIDATSSLEDKTKDIQGIKEELKKLKNKIDEHKSIRNLREEEVSLQTELFWSKVRDAELEVDAEKNEVNALSKKCDIIKQNSIKKTDEINILKQSIEDVEHQVVELKKTIEIQSRPYADAKKTLERLTVIYQEKEREKRSLQSSIKSKNQDIQVLEQDIANANESKNKVHEEKTERARLMGELEQKIKAIDDILTTSRNDLFQIKSDISRKHEDDQNLKQEIREIDQKISQHQERFNSLKNESGNTLLLYGRHIPKVKQLIKQYEKKFHQLPRGPLGSYIKLKDKKWAVAAEGYIGSSLLNSFIVDDKQDNQLLLKIFKQVAPERIPTIITSKFFDKVHDVTNNKVQAPPDCIGLFDVLEFEDPVVANCVIDESSIEGILLIPSDDRAMTLLSNKAHVPSKCSQGITIKGDRYFPDPNYKSYCSDYHQAQYLQIDASEHLRHLERTIEDLNRQKQTILNQYKQVKNDMNLQVSKQNELETKIRRLLGNRNDSRRQLDELRSAPEPEAANIDVLENELTEVKSALNEKTADLERLNNELKELKIPIKETEIRINKLRSASRSLEERLPSLQEEIRGNNIRIKELSTSDEFDNRKIADYEARLQEHRTILVTKQAKLDSHTDKAEHIGTRPTEIRKVPEIMEKLNSIERAIRRIQTSNESADEVLEQYRLLNEKYSMAKMALKTFTESVNELKIATKKRKKHYKVTENYFISYIKHSFKKILEYRQFKGSLNIDVETQKLELIVIPQQGSQGLTTTSNLSGGERSFSTVAFLYSLWQCMELPFYFLDEFDVYMDKLNRTKVFDILLHHAGTKPQLQFVFLTPQDVSFLNKKVTILRLENPKRFNA
ncbi:hypothetical protein WA026_002412 [Henosepilachna vigintioctopunctata]|uniref:RecF/RecN/SMC N-terminal domain-containing protein n=1 Tax=Henosepilachna vigintioctopunctata TaxID=420089 RepID=A0AAW1U0A6_9CUCU